MSWLLLAAVGAVAVGGAVTVARRTFTSGLWLQLVGAVCLAVAGFAVMARGSSHGSGFSSTLEPQVGVDPTSAFFLGTLGLVASASLLFATRYLSSSPAHRAAGALTAPFLLAITLFLTARDPLTLLAGWELMSLVPAAIILVTRGQERAARRAVFVYVAVTHLGGTGAWVAILLLARADALGGAAVLEPGSGLQVAVAVAALVGFGTKAGLMPLHTWLPRAHPIAPAPVSALMSGVMIKAALYGLVRVLVEWVGILPLWVGGLVVGVGAVSAVGGVVYALFQHDLKRLLAFHSIENVGIIVLGIGAALVLHNRGENQWAALALAASFLHTLNHAILKALLFLGAGAFERAVGELEIDRLGGLLRRMPVTGGAFLVGSMAIAGVPPFNGFASEWLTLQALLHIPGTGGVGDGTVGVVALAALGATAALAVFCFVKVVGLVLLGRERREAIAAACDPPVPMRVAVASLAVFCLVLGAGPGLLVDPLVAVAPWEADAPTYGGLYLPDTGTLPLPFLVFLLVAVTGVLVVVRGRRGAAAPAPTWACGQLVEPQLDWTSAGFTKPLRLVLEPALRPEREIEVVSARGVVQRVSYTGRVPHLFDVHLYEPLARAALRGARHARRLQTGRLGSYVAYLIALVLVLLAAARWDVIG